MTKNNKRCNFWDWKIKYCRSQPYLHLVNKATFLTANAYVQAVRPFKGFAADGTDVFPFLAVSQAVFAESTGTAEHLPTEAAAQQRGPRRAEGTLSSPCRSASSSRLLWCHLHGKPQLWREGERGILRLLLRWHASHLVLKTMSLSKTLLLEGSGPWVLMTEHPHKNE